MVGQVYIFELLEMDYEDGGKSFMRLSIDKLNNLPKREELTDTL